MGRRVGWLLLLISACGGIERPGPDASARAVSECGPAAENVVDLAKWGRVTPTNIAKMKAAIAARCDSDKWPLQAQRCFGAMKVEQDDERCIPMLTQAQREAVANDVSAELPKDPPETDVAGQPCVTTSPVVVTTEDLTATSPTGSTTTPPLCKTAGHALASLPYGSTLGPGGFEVHVRLKRLDTLKDNTISCSVSISVGTQGVKFGATSGGATLRSTGATDRDLQLARNECVEAVVEDLIARQIGPSLQSRLATTP